MDRDHPRIAEIEFLKNNRIKKGRGIDAALCYRCGDSRAKHSHCQIEVVAIAAAGIPASSTHATGMADSFLIFKPSG